ncbi:alpha/beta fold hydrolase [Sporosarcina sp. Te-1]|uniref:alpha/beta fold hydrolase n=1 Tax=Sporosarcina sp. Te-1 TaxID=2818390 RepID=UPI001A9E510E|nr:alpha/beta hydrolase [Sporosarcina sp. Te-1]QTD43133.1 alpha/beta hydrolase [Sporosarcina sp. Te-1]
MPILNTNGIMIHYEVKGEGKPIVFTHGASWDSSQWREQVAALENEFTTIVWDVRGHGHSSLSADKFDSEDFVKDLISLLDHLQIKQASLCGLSMGGHISLQTAIRHPHRVSSLVLIGTPFTNQFNWYEKIAVPINRWTNRIMPISWLAKLQAIVLSKYNPANRVYIEEAVRSLSHSDWNRLWDVISRMESKEDLEQVHCPTLILYGEHDSLIKRQQVYMHERIKDSILFPIRHAHHATNMDNPQEVNERIRTFLRAESKRAPIHLGGSSL